MKKTTDSGGKPSWTWPAESEIEAYRKDLEASFLTEESALLLKREEVVARLDQMETNTVSETDREKEALNQRREEVMRSVRQTLDSRYSDFLSGFVKDELLEELASKSLSLLFSTYLKVEEDSLDT